MLSYQNKALCNSLTNGNSSFHTSHTIFRWYEFAYFIKPTLDALKWFIEDVGPKNRANWVVFPTVQGREEESALSLEASWQYLPL